MTEPVPSSPSWELQQANRRLHKLRQQEQSYKVELGLMGSKRPSPDVPPWEDAELTKAAQHTAAIVTKLPPHLGWGSVMASLAIRNAINRREREGTKLERLTAEHLLFRPIVDENDQLDQLSDSHSQSPASYQLRLPLDGDTVKHYPTIGIAALKQERAAIYRVWLLCRYLDEPGRGWLPVQDVKELLTDKESNLRLFGWRRLRQLLGQGHGRFWSWEKGNGRVWLFGAARTAANLEVNRLTGKPVALPLSVIIESISTFKAHLFGTWHSGRKTNNPISRHVQETITGIPERTQRYYCKIAKVERKSNIAIGRKHTPENAEEAAWQHSRAVFVFKDHRGEQGRKGASYIAWQLPNSYIGPHQQTTNGRMRKINRKLKVLVQKGAQGNDSEKVEKLYHANGAEAARALNPNQGAMAYWPMLMYSQRSFLWAIFSLA